MHLKTLKFYNKWFQLHDYLNIFARENPKEDIPQSVGHYFEEKLHAFINEEKDEESRKVKVALADWFMLWEEVDTGVDDLKKQVKNILFNFINFKFI